MEFFSLKISNEEAVDFVNAVVNKEQNIMVEQLNQLSDSLVNGSYIFIQLGGDRVSWDKGLIGLAQVIKEPYDFGYDAKNKRNYRINIRMCLVLKSVIKREEFVAYPETFDAGGIGPATKGEQNQAIKRINENQAAVIVRAMMDRQPEIEEEVDHIFPKEFVNKIKGKVQMLFPKDVAFGEDIVGKKRLFEKTDLVGSNILLYGVPGSGKSHTIKKEYCDNEEFMERVVFHPEYSYTDFVGQILPTIKDDKLEYIFTPGPMTKILKKAYENPQSMFYLIIEEINRGNAPAIFGDIFQLLDRDLTGVSEYGITNAEMSKEIYNVENVKIKIPGNLTILATMNTSDQNVFTLDTAFKRRWSMKMIRNDFSKCEHAKAPIWDTKVTWGGFATKVNNIIIENSSNGIGNTDKRLGAYFVRLNDLHRTTNAFPEKVLMYLWDDVFKYDRESIFNTDKYPTFEDVVDGFCNNQFDVFNVNFDDEEK